MTDDKQPANKHHKLEEKAASLDDLNDDCLLSILASLAAEDLSSIAVAN